MDPQKLPDPLGILGTFRNLIFHPTLNLGDATICNPRFHHSTDRHRQTIGDQWGEQHHLPSNVLLRRKKKNNPGFTIIYRYDYNILGILTIIYHRFGPVAPTAAPGAAGP